MHATSSSPSPNRLLASLASSPDLHLLQAHLAPVTLALGQVLETPDKRVDAVYFPEAGFASVVAVQKGDTKVEVGLIGREGMTGLTIVLGNHRAPHETYMQAAGRGQCIKTPALRKAMQGLLLKYVQVFMVQTAHTAVANARVKIEERLARWILMAHDRLDGTSLPLTHEFLSLMLGVRRAGVTEALHALEALKLIRSGRGQIVVLNRKGIERSFGG